MYTVFWHIFRLFNSHINHQNSFLVFGERICKISGFSSYNIPFLINETERYNINIHSDKVLLNDVEDQQRFKYLPFRILIIYLNFKKKVTNLSLTIYRYDWFRNVFYWFQERKCWKILRAI